MLNKFKHSILPRLTIVALIVTSIVAFCCFAWGQSQPASSDTSAVTQSWGSYISLAIALAGAIGVLIQRLESAVTKVVSELAKLQSSAVTVDPQQNRALLDAIAKERRADCVGFCGKKNGCIGADR